MEEIKSRFIYAFNYPIWEHPYMVLIIGLISLTISFITTVISVVLAPLVALTGILLPIKVILLTIINLIITCLDLAVLYGIIITIMYWIYLSSGKALFWKEHFAISKAKII